MPRESPHWLDRPRNLFVVPLILTAIAGAIDLGERIDQVSELEHRVTTLEHHCRGPSE